MPKKPARNSFYFYMLDFKEKQKRQGITYANMAEVSEAAGPAWREEPPSVRARFESEAKAEKQLNNVPEKKYTSYGVPLSVVMNTQKMQQDAENAEKKDIQDFVMTKSFNKEILDEDIYIIDVNSYCKVQEVHLIGEVAVLRLSVRDGIRDCYHQLVYPGPAPVGYASDVKAGMQDLGLPAPDSGPRSSPAQLLALLIDYLRQRRARGALPPLYTHPDKVPQVLDYIQQLCQRAAEDEDIFRVYQLHLLFHWLVKAVSAKGDELPRDNMALIQLNKDAFKYTPRLGCKHHEQGELSIECSLARVKRWAYTILDMTCARAGLPAVPGRHLPSDFDVDGIISYRETHAPPAGGWGAAAGADSTLPSANSTATDGTLDTTLTSATSAARTDGAAGAAGSAGGARPKRVHVPMRPAKVDYAEMSRAAPPALHERSEFPEFPPRSTRGRGRGAGLSGSFQNMSM